ncbi:MAG: ubiquinone/menaquinone biosynthesis methyltransferase [Candidatus Kapaibacteriota bacterium]|jgi:demethylmenaquinone methyltransferase/2-methoxy-6-polyprenyl-1,4-benzoquinol methylase
MLNKIGKMFNDISRRYDLLNDILSFGVHRLWLKRAVRSIPLKDNYKILDLATGTGNFAFTFLKENPTLEVTGIDIAENMLEIARYKNWKFGRKANFVVGDATQIPYPSDTFDLVSISFGIRNVQDIKLCLYEIFRVLKPTGHFLIVEFGRPKSWFKPFYWIYQMTIIRYLGGLIGRNFSAYNYLVRTVNNFPSDKKFVELLEKTNLFESIKYIPLTFGIAYIYTGKPKK